MDTGHSAEHSVFIIGYIHPNHVECHVYQENVSDWQTLLQNGINDKDVQNTYQFTAVAFWQKQE